MDGRGSVCGAQITETPPPAFDLERRLPCVSMRELLSGGAEMESWPPCRALDAPSRAPWAGPSPLVDPGQQSRTAYRGTGVAAAIASSYQTKLTSSGCRRSAISLLSNRDQ